MVDATKYFCVHVLTVYAVEDYLHVKNNQYSTSSSLSIVLVIQVSLFISIHDIVKLIEVYSRVKKFVKKTM